MFQRQNVFIYRNHPYLQTKSVALTEVNKRQSYSHSFTCAYPHCQARSRDSIDGVKFFRFPVTDQNRTAKWISNSGLDHLAEEHNSVLRKHALCSRHFLATDILPSGLLRRSALPVELSEYDVGNEAHAKDDRATWDGERQALRKRLSRMRRAFLKLKAQNTTLEYSSKAKSKALNRLRVRMAQGILEDDTLAAAIKRRVQGFLCTFIMMQLFHINGTSYTKEEKEISVKMHYTSPSLYDKMREELGFVLPSVSSMKTWFGSIQLWPGICSSLFEYLRIKVNCMCDEERQCVLMFDEMSLKKSFDFHEPCQKIEGFQDLGSLGTGPGVATSAMVFMVRGLFSNWKQPVAYFINSGVIHGSKISILIDRVLEAVLRAGLNVRAIVCDQGTNNRSALYGKISGTEPFFMHGEKKIYTIFDVPHLFKSLRNQLLNYDIVMDKSERISWKDVLALWRLESDKGTRAALKLSEKHVAPNCFEKMKCRLALQVFSRRVSAAMLTAHALGAINSDTIVHTANAFGLLNDLFDNLDSRRSMDANPQKCALSIIQPHVEKNIRSSMNEMKKWRTINNGRTKIPPCFQGFDFTITAVLQLWRDLQSEGTRFLMTARLNQDPLENLFSMIRTYGGSYNQNPTAKSFRLILQKNIVINLVKPARSSNCMQDDDVVLLEEAAGTSTRDGIFCTVNKELTDQFRHSAGDERVHNESVDFDHDPVFIDSHINDNNTLEQCAIEYFAGYIAMKSIAGTGCERCKAAFSAKNQQYTDARQTLIFYRAYDTLNGDELGHLSVPSDEYSFIFSIMNAIFDRAYPPLRSEYGILDKVYILMEKAVHTGYPKWFEDATCGKHRKRLAYTMMKVKIHKDLKWLGNSLRNFSRSDGKPPQKLKNLHNW